MAKKKSSEELYEQAQRNMVACLLASGDNSVDVSDVAKSLETVDEDDFEEPDLKHIFRAEVELFRHDKPLTLFAVATQLSDWGLLEQVGGNATLKNLKFQGERELMKAPVTMYASYVREHSMKSKIYHTVSEKMSFFLPDSGVSASEGISLFQNDLNERMYSLSSDETTSTTVDLADSFVHKLEERERIRKENEESAGGLQGIPSLLPGLDEVTSGWIGGQMIVVGAQTGIGKSVFAVNCAVAAGQANKSVMFFALEMSRDEIENRIVSCYTGIPLNALKQGNVRNRDMLNNGLQQLREMKITIDTESDVTVDSIRARALKQAQSAEGLDMIIVDYLQLMKPSSRSENRQVQVADMSRELKLLAKSLNVPVMVLVQLTRPKDEEQMNALPNRFMIRESGAIANDADLIVLLHRPESGGASLAYTSVIVDKNRDGPSGVKITCHSDLGCSVFREIANPHEELDDDGEDDIDNSIFAGGDTIGEESPWDSTFENTGW